LLSQEEMIAAMMTVAAVPTVEEIPPLFYQEKTISLI
jgi:hypothetical protein